MFSFFSGLRCIVLTRLINFIQISEIAELQGTISVLRQQLSSILDNGYGREDSVISTSLVESSQENGEPFSGTNSSKETCFDENIPSSTTGLSHVFSNEVHEETNKESSLKTQVLMQVIFFQLL